MTHKQRTIAVVLTATLVFLLVAWWGWASISARVQPDEIRRQVLEELTGLLPPEVATVSVESAKLELDSGLIIRNLTITPHGDQSPPTLSVERIFARIDALSLTTGNKLPERVELTGVQLQIHRQSDGRWQHDQLVASIARSLRSQDTSEGETVFPNVFLTRGQVRYVDESAGTKPVDLSLDSLEAQVTAVPSMRATSTPDVVISLQGENPLLGSLNARVRWQSFDSRLFVDRATVRVDLSRRHEVSLPQAIGDQADRMSLGGVLTIDGSCELDRDRKLSNLDLNCEVTRGSLVLPSGFHFKSVHGTIEIHDDELRLRNLRALTPAGSAEADGHARLDALSIVEKTGETPVIRDVKVGFDLHNVTINKELLATIPPILRQVIEENRIEGRFGIQGKIDSAAWPPHPNDLTLQVILHDVSAQPEAFPYPLGHGVGSVSLRDMYVRTEEAVRATAGPGQMDIILDLDLTKVMEVEGPSVRGELIITAEDIPGDSTLRGALPEDGQEIWDVFAPSGRGEARVHLLWSPGHDFPRIRLDLQPHSGQMVFRHFPLPLHGLHGTMRFDLGHDSDLVEIVEAAGEYRSNVITGSGTYRSMESGFDGKFNVKCASMKLDQHILRLLPPDVQGPLNTYRVSRNVGVDADIRMNEGADSTEEWTGNYELTLSQENQVVVHPPGMAFPFILTGGTIQANDHEVVFEDITCIDPTAIVSGRVDRDGNIEISGTAQKLPLGERLLGLFPETVRGDMRDLDLRGEAGFDFVATVTAPESEGAGRSYGVTLSNVETEEAGLDVGFRTRHIRCQSGTLQGKGVFGKHHQFDGTFDVSSSRLDRLEIENATVRISYGKPHAALGVPDGTALEESGYVVTQEMRNELQAPSTGETLQMLVGPATIYGGKARGFLFADFSDLGDLKGHFLVDGLDLAVASGRLFEGQSYESTGTMSGEVRFSGLTGESTELIGNGSFRIEDGALGEGPVLSKVVTELESGSEEDFEFNSVQAVFTIQGEKFHAAPGKIKIEGPRLNLSGHGSMDFNWVVDLVLVPRFLANTGILGRQLGEIRVMGPIDNPRHSVKVLPALNK